MNHPHNLQAIRDDLLSVTVRYLEMEGRVRQDHPILAYHLRDMVGEGHKALKSLALEIRDLAAAGEAHD